MSTHPDIDTIPLKEWNSGVFSSTLREAGIVPKPRPMILYGKAHHTNDTKPPPPKPIKEGTVEGTRAALTDIYTRAIQRHSSFFDVVGFEPSIPQESTYEDREDLYTWSDPKDGYPPHLSIIPKKNQDSLLEIFNAMRLADTVSIVKNILPESWLDWVHGNPDDGQTISELEQRNKTLRKGGSGLFSEANVGDEDNWYSDAVFAQQQFTGTNPVTIQRASENWVGQFKEAAADLGNTAALELLNTAQSDSLYVQDCSYFRDAVGAAPDSTFISDDDLKHRRYGCAAVTLFQLHDDGKLHPLAIVIDYKRSMKESVKIFNKRLSPSDSTSSEAGDWPWRYAKTAAQISDWTHHELTTHLVNTHFVEEAVMVSAYRAFDSQHLIFRLLEPHWFRTLSLNAAARSTLVPAVVAPLSGMATAQVYAFIRDAYKRFDWVGNYVPNDLARRGFPPEKLATDKKFHNYAYGQNIYLIWKTLRVFVDKVLRTKYTSDQDVVADVCIKHWYENMQSSTGGQMSTFPTIKTVEELVDAVTMAIHIASPQHTAVNYLQMYYQAFVIAKPPAFYEQIPTSENELHEMTDKKLTKALPSNRPPQWLLASHLPYLLSVTVAKEQNLPNYALSAAKIARLNKDQKFEEAATQLYWDLGDLKTVFQRISDQLDGRIQYMVLDPEVTATSILI